MIKGPKRSISIEMRLSRRKMKIGETMIQISSENNLMQFLTTLQWKVGSNRTSTTSREASEIWTETLQKDDKLIVILYRKKSVYYSFALLHVGLLVNKIVDILSRT